MKQIAFALSIAIIFLTLGCNKTKRSVINEIPSPSFSITYHHGEPNRAVRKKGKMYQGKIIDTHAHLYPPPSNQSSKEEIDRQVLQEIISTITSAGIETIIVMPTPNDGIRPNQEMGVVLRKVARELNRDTISVFYGSNYIINWLHNAYHYGYEESELTPILKRLAQESGEYIGVGELSFYHFDKGYGKRQHVIEFPPNFEPFQKILDVITKKGLWIDLHAEPVTKEGVSYENKTFGGVELMLKRNPNLKIIYSHTAMTNSSNVRQILQKFPQIMMNIKIEPKHDRWGHLGPVVNPKGDLYEDWAQLFEEMPERFMVGSDFHFGRRGVKIKRYKKRIKQYRYMLGTLEERTARMIAYENARQLIDDGRNKLLQRNAQQNI